MQVVASNSPDTILLTGATGYVGGHLLRRLEDDQTRRRGQHRGLRQLNFSRNATRNAENILVIEHPGLGDLFADYIEKLAARYR